MEKTSLTAADVELWLNDNVDWLRDYLQRHHSTLDDTQSRHTVPAQSRCDSTPSPWHSRSHTTAVDEASVTSATSHMTSSTHQQQQVRHDVTVAELTSPPRANLLIVTSDAVERTASDSSALPTQRYTPSHLYNTSSQVYTSLSHVQTDSKRHLRRHFAKSRMRVTDGQFCNDLTSDKSSASFDWFVPHTHRCIGLLSCRRWYINN